MKPKELVEKLIEASNIIQKGRNTEAIYIQLSKEYIQQKADEKNISFDAMVEIIQNELNPK